MTLFLEVMGALFMGLITMIVSCLIRKFISEHTHSHQYEIYGVGRQSAEVQGKAIEELQLYMRCRKCKKEKTIKFVNSGIELIPNCETVMKGNDTNEQT